MLRRRDVQGSAITGRARTSMFTPAPSATPSLGLQSPAAQIAAQTPLSQTPVTGAGDGSQSSFGNDLSRDQRGYGFEWGDLESQLGEAVGGTNSFGGYTLGDHSTLEAETGEEIGKTNSFGGFGFDFGDLESQLGESIGGTKGFDVADRDRSMKETLADTVGATTGMTMAEALAAVAFGTNPVTALASVPARFAVNTMFGVAKNTVAKPAITSLQRSITSNQGDTGGFAGEIGNTGTDLGDQGDTTSPGGSTAQAQADSVMGLGGPSWGGGEAGRDNVTGVTDMGNGTDLGDQGFGSYGGYNSDTGGDRGAAGDTGGGDGGGVGRGGGSIGGL